MIRTVVRQYRWSVEEIDKLYLDDLDYYGLEFWYNDVKAIEKELKQSTKPKK